MSFAESIRTVFSKYATFSGRARRSEYWWWWLFILLGSIVFVLVDNVLSITFTDSLGGSTVTAGWTTLIFALVTLIPGIAVTIRRLHDTGRSGVWWVLSLLCGIGAIILFVMCLMDSAPDNEYGPNPKGGMATA
jgi:uncharacterized membrane protein YhaH (DUF805 family)